MPTIKREHRGVISILLVFVWFCGTVFGSSCNSEGKCNFGGVCIAGRCYCRANCYDKGPMIICGADGRHYLNYCQIKIKSCELQREIKIRCVGSCTTCSDQRLSSIPHSSRGQIRISDGLAWSVCPMSEEFCMNYGMCVKGESAKTCICPNGFKGKRCEQKESPKRSKYEQISLRESKRIVDLEIIPVVLSVIFVFGLLFIGMVISAIYYRAKSNRLKNILKNNEEDSNTKCRSTGYFIDKLQPALIGKLQSSTSSSRKENYCVNSRTDSEIHLQFFPDSRDRKPLHRTHSNRLLVTNRSESFGRLIVIGSPIPTV